MSWNHRVMAIEDPSGEYYLQIHEVYYNEDGEPISYINDPITIGGEDIKGISWTLDAMQYILNKPILFHGEDFPKVYTPKKVGW